MINQILEIARWAPSGDNGQPWRFKIITPFHCQVHAFDFRESQTFDYRGNYSQIAVGCLLENISIAASLFHYTATITKRAGSDDSKPIFDVFIEESPHLPTDPLAPFIEKRVTNRLPLSREMLTNETKNDLERSLPPEYSVDWLETKIEKRKIAHLLFVFDKIRLALPGAYDIVQWNVQYSKNHIPDQALGIPSITLAFMRLLVKYKSSFHFMMDYLGGSLTSRIMLDVIPSIFCSAHFVLSSRSIPRTPDEYCAFGRAFQRFWLTAAKNNLYLQPESGPLIFSRYVRDNCKFSDNPKLWQLGIQLKEEFDTLFSAVQAPHIMMMGRIGKGKAPSGRSIRYSLEELTQQ